MEKQLQEKLMKGIRIKFTLVMILLLFSGFCHVEAWGASDAESFEDVIISLNGFPNKIMSIGSRKVNPPRWKRNAEKIECELIVLVREGLGGQRIRDKRTFHDIPATVRAIGETFITVSMKNSYGYRIRFAFEKYAAQVDVGDIIKIDLQYRGMDIAFDPGRKHHWGVKGGIRADVYDNGGFMVYYLVDARSDYKIPCLISKGGAPFRFSDGSLRVTGTNVEASYIDLDFRGINSTVFTVD